MKKKNPLGRRKVASAECELNVDHITITLQTSGCGHATFGFRRAPATWCILANKGFTNLAIVTKFSPLPEPCDNGKTTTCGSVYRARSVNGEVDGSAGARKLFERIIRRRRDMQRLIPYRTRGMVARPASGHSCRPTSL